MTTDQRVRRERQVAVVAGAGPGLGAAIARRFHAAGIDVAVLSRDPHDVTRALVAEATSNAEVAGFGVNLADPGAIKTCFEEIVASLGDPTVLVYNAAVMRPAKTMDLEPALFAHDLALAVEGALVCAQAVYPAMKRARTGTMLFTGGGFALYPHAGKGMASLVAGKSALRGFVLALAPELALDGIHVATVTVAGAIAPGTAFDPDVIAERYSSLHSEPFGSWTIETVFDGCGNGDAS